MSTTMAEAPEPKPKLKPAVLVLDALPELIAAAHGAAVDCGWWTDLATGKIAQRNTGELLMLVISELAEAATGFYTAAPDDKLPRRSNFEVELADTIIRICDMAGHYKLDLPGACAMLATLTPDQDREWHRYLDLLARFVDDWTIDRALLLSVQYCGRAMEAYRRSAQSAQLPQYDGLTVELAKCIRALTYMAGALGFHLRMAIDEKIAFNRGRHDHTLAARRRLGGKRV